MLSSRVITQAIVLSRYVLGYSRIYYIYPNLRKITTLFSHFRSIYFFTGGDSDMPKRTRDIETKHIEYWILRDGNKIDGVHNNRESADMFAAIEAVENPDSVFTVVKVEQDYRCPNGTTMHVRRYTGY
jgi:hypothetical protein